MWVHKLLLTATFNLTKATQRFYKRQLTSSDQRYELAPTAQDEQPHHRWLPVHHRTTLNRPRRHHQYERQPLEVAHLNTLVPDNQNPIPYNPIPFHPR